MKNTARMTVARRTAFICLVLLAAYVLFQETADDVVMRDATLSAEVVTPIFDCLDQDCGVQYFGGSVECLCEDQEASNVVGNKEALSVSDNVVVADLDSVETIASTDWRINLPSAARDVTVPWEYAMQGKVHRLDMPDGNGVIIVDFPNSTAEPLVIEIEEGKLKP